MPREALEPRVLSADCAGAVGRLFKEPEAGGLQCPREPDGWTVGNSTRTLGGSQASVKAIPTPTVYPGPATPWW